LVIRPNRRRKGPLVYSQMAFVLDGALDKPWYLETSEWDSNW